MSAGGWVRRAHRWTSLAFTATVIANFVALAGRPASSPGGSPPAWLTYAPLVPLALLLLTGLYLFARPYVATGRDRPAS